MITSPIFINTFVVFVRLYWFERRFRGIVQDPRNLRRTRTRTMTMPNDTQDLGRAEEGVRGRNIVVMHDGHKLSPNESLGRKHVDFEDSGSGSSSDRGVKTGMPEHGTGLSQAQDPTFHRDITFADEIRRPNNLDSEQPMLPQRLSPEQHIAFLENQRNPKDKGALRIPGPREYDEGFEPKQLDENEMGEGGDLEHEMTGTLEPKRNVRINEPRHPRLKIETDQIKKPSNRYAHERADDEQTPAEDKIPFSARLRARTGTLSSLRGWASTENDHTAPYLSYQPTVGRNSAFVDLTEEQREELGGIEYRSLKTLAVILVGTWLKPRILIY